MNKHVFAVIGFQHGHLNAFIEEMLALGHECAGVYDPDDSKLAQAAAERFGVPLVREPDRLLGPEISVIGSASVNSGKIDVIELCERHGKSIMLDKPAVTNRNGYERLKAVIDRGRIQVGMLLTERVNPPIYTLKRHIDRGDLGEIVAIGMRKPHRLNAANRPSWFFSKALNGGIIIDILIHDMDLLRWLTGREIVDSQGFLGKYVLPEHPDFYDVAHVQAVLEGGIVAQLYADWHTPGKSWTWGDGRIFVTGTEGCAELRLNGDPFVGGGALMLRVTNREEAVKVEVKGPPFTITEDFMNRVEGRPSLVTHEDILRATLATVEADERARPTGPLGRREG